MLRVVPFALMLTWALVAQGDTKPATDSKPATAKLEVVVPSYRNANCPLTSEPTDAAVFIDSSHGRVWLCCKDCLEGAKKDPDGTYARAYPTTTKLNNTTDPVSGKPVKKGAVVLYRGYEINLADAGNAKAVAQNGDVYVTLLRNPQVKDIGNAKDPITNDPVVDNLIVLIGDSLVHLSTADSVEAIKKDPANALEKAQKGAKAGRKAG